VHHEHQQHRNITIKQQQKEQQQQLLSSASTIFKSLTREGREFIIYTSNADALEVYNHILVTNCGGFHRF
jgi:uncharacterized protein YhaN